MPSCTINRAIYPTLAPYVPTQTTPDLWPSSFLKIKTLTQASISPCHRKSQSSRCALPPRLGGPCRWCLNVVGCFLTDTAIRDCYACLSLPSIIDHPQREPLRRRWLLLFKIQVRQTGQTDWQADYFPVSSRLCLTPDCWYNDEWISAQICTDEELMIRKWGNDRGKTGCSGVYC